MAAEKRRNDRICYELPMTFMFVERNDPALLTAKELLEIRDGKICDFSSAGLHIATEDIEERLTRYLLAGKLFLGVRFQFPFDDEMIYAVAKVMWAKKNFKGKSKAYFMGLQFINIGMLDHLKIRKNIIAHRTKQKT
ncbi:MAG: PilZ domain-containing protein [Candidatus Omnitrophica bacterium]|nr:PilZ domain-containing protein [Candidatus Omnitrophota bacterium]